MTNIIRTVGISAEQPPCAILLKQTQPHEIVSKNSTQCILYEITTHPCYSYFQNTEVFNIFLIVFIIFIYNGLHC